MNGDHASKNYLVVGASSGIGARVCSELSGLGANIILVARRKEKLEELVRAMPPGYHTALPFDVTELHAISSVIDQISGHYGSIDGCVYCAALADTPRLRDLVPERLHAVMTVNFFAFLEFVRCLIGKKPKEQVLRIVGISSLASVSNEKYLTAYAASKAAMDAAVRCLSVELVAKNTTINNIRPAVVDTERLQHLHDLTGDLSMQIKKSGYQPQGIIPPEDVAKLAAYLLSDCARFITGTTMPINGGALC